MGMSKAGVTTVPVRPTANGFDAGLRATLTDVLGNSAHGGVDREALAKKLTRRLKRPVHKAQLDQWCAPSQWEKRMPVDALLAVCEALQDFRLVRYVAEALGLKAMTPAEARCAEFGALVAMERQTKAKQDALVQSMDAGVVEQLIEKLKGEAK